VSEPACEARRPDLCGTLTQTFHLNLCAACAAQARPAAALRGRVRAALPAVLPPALAELAGWTPALRAAAARQLRALMLLGEAAAAPHLPALLAALAAAAGAVPVGPALARLIGTAVTACSSASPRML